MTISEQYALVASGTQLPEVLSDNLGGDKLSTNDLDRVRIPAGGGIAWEVPSLEGTELMKELSGVIVYWKTTRVYWDTPFGNGEPQPPTCASAEGENGIGDPGGPCEHCPLNQWGTDPKGGKGKACREVRILFLIRPQSLLPMAVMLPPSSIKPLRTYFLRLASQGIPYYGVVSKLSLRKVANDGGINYSEVVIGMDTMLPLEERAQWKELSQRFKPILSPVTVAQSDLE